MKYLSLLSGLFLTFVLAACHTLEPSDATANPFAPEKMNGQTYLMSVTTGSDPFATQGTWLIQFSATGSSYRVMGDGQHSVDSQGQYEQFDEGALRHIAFNDTGIGTGNFILNYSTATSGTFAATLDAVEGAQQLGSFSLHP